MSEALAIPKKRGWPKGKKRGPRKKKMAGGTHGQQTRVQDLAPVEDLKKVPKAEPGQKHLKVSRLQMDTWVQYTVLEVTNSQEVHPGEHFDSKHLADLQAAGWHYTVVKI